MKVLTSYYVFINKRKKGSKFSPQKRKKKKKKKKKKKRERERDVVRQGQSDSDRGDSDRQVTDSREEEVNKRPGHPRKKRAQPNP